MVEEFLYFHFTKDFICRFSFGERKTMPYLVASAGMLLSLGTNFDSKTTVSVGKEDTD